MQQEAKRSGTLQFGDYQGRLTFVFKYLVGRNEEDGTKFLVLSSESML